MNETNKKNMRAMVSMLEAIKKKKGAAPFVYQERLQYEYYTKNGMPYYKREERYSRKDEPMPVPVFIINDKAYVGFGQYVISSIEKDIERKI
jgi:glutaredoxin